MNITQIAAVFLIVSAILLNASATLISLIFFSIALSSFAYFAIKGKAK